MEDAIAAVLEVDDIRKEAEELKVSIQNL